MMINLTCEHLNLVRLLEDFKMLNVTKSQKVFLFSSHLPKTKKKCMIGLDGLKSISFWQKKNSFYNWIQNSEFCMNGQIAGVTVTDH